MMLGHPNGQRSALSIPSSPTPLFSVWGCLASQVASLDAAYLISVNIFNRLKAFT